MGNFQMISLVQALLGENTKTTLPVLHYWKIIKHFFWKPSALFIATLWYCFSALTKYVSCLYYVKCQFASSNGSIFWKRGLSCDIILQKTNNKRLCTWNSKFLLYFKELSTWGHYIQRVQLFGNISIRYLNNTEWTINRLWKCYRTKGFDNWIKFLLCSYRKLNFDESKMDLLQMKD